MVTPVFLQFAALAVTVVIGVCVVYAIAEMLRAHRDQQEKLLRAVSAVETFQKLQPEFVSFLRRIESDGRALQTIALQVEVAVAELREGISISVTGAAEKQAAMIENLRDHLDSQEERLAKILTNISDTLPSLPPPSENPAPARLRREALSQDPVLRFSVLRDWISVNALAILHRASRGWANVNDLTGNIPSYLEPDPEILNDSVLVIGTRGHQEKLAIPLRNLEVSSDFGQWFDPTSEGQTKSHIPAVLVRSNGHFDLVTKGTAPL